MTFEADSLNVDLVTPGRGFERGKLISDPSRVVHAIVIHTTGYGPIRRHLAKPARFKTPFDAAIFIYQKLMDASAHYVVSQRGEVAQTVPEACPAWHVGGAKSRAYWRRSWGLLSKRYRWWGRIFPGLASPRDLAGGLLWAPYRVKVPLIKRLRYLRSWGKGSANANTIGIEVVPPVDSKQWTITALTEVAELVRDIAERNDIEIRQDTVISHSEAHPLARTNKKGQPWDPDAKNMFRLRSLLGVS